MDCHIFIYSFFFSHNFFHNGIILALGLILFFSKYKKKYNSLKSYLNFILIIFGILILGLLISKSHDDFSYYHFPYTYYLTQESLIIGVGNLNHGFRTPSSIFISIHYFTFHL